MSILMDTMWEKMGNPPKCVGTDGRTEPVITFYPWQDKEWTFPWSRQETQAFGDEDETEKVEVFFPHYRIVVLGQNLRGARENLRKFQVYSLRSFPLEYRVKYPPDAPFIWQIKIEVKPVA